MPRFARLDGEEAECQHACRSPFRATRVLIWCTAPGKGRAIPRLRSVTAIALLFAAASLSACTHSPGGHAAAGSDEQRAAPPDGVPVVVAARMVCRIAADVPGAAAAQVRGVDGAPSVVVGGTGYWFFGDTLRAGPGGRQDVIPATVATTSDADGGDCVDLRFKQSAGLAQPLFPRRDETTAWPDGILPLDDGSIAFYMVKVRRESPFAWHVESVGLGRVAPGTTDGTRSIETIWEGNSGFPARVSGARSPVRVGGDVIVYLHTDDGANYAAKAPLDRIADATAYTYWDGSGWTPRPADARPLWPTSHGALPADNGVAVTYDAGAGRWLAIYNGDLATVQVRTAPQPWGPWSEPVTWFDCRPLVGQQYPYCYSAELHRELSRDDATLYLTFSSQQPYDVTLVELRLGVSMHEWRAADGTLRYAASAPAGELADDGVAFYASGRPLPGLDPVYLRDDGTYALGAPVPGTEPAFYAYAAPSPGPVRTMAVYRWRRDGREALDARDRQGWARSGIAFYVPCVEIGACSQ